MRRYPDLYDMEAEEEEEDSSEDEDQPTSKKSKKTTNKKIVQVSHKVIEKSKNEILIF